jgi:tRNA G18 (ribose-2'-O)-methylase SpoU
MKNKPVVILYNIRSTHNVGSIFRTADAVGISHVYLIGYTPAPIDRFGRPRKDIAKISLGAEISIPSSHHETIEEVITILRGKDYQLIAIEQSQNSIDYKKVTIKKPVAFILGEEVNGLPETILNAVDTIAEIPMAGMKESLNVSVAFGIAVFRILDK